MCMGIDFASSQVLDTWIGRIFSALLNSPQAMLMLPVLRPHTFCEEQSTKVWIVGDTKGYYVKGLAPQLGASRRR